ncbi:sister chromatid cohesion 1 protein 4 isoform X1 [Nicotiana tomentosiformis]|uniref:sister chromatid cohesion 1 protein 4 isoform X1 n=1 Tax=Nicotiana tomentosiformis TaxID=4098 RepID=UPI00051AE178|nr:PREDICTED: sister chromatid cohesion 1 protein 4-like isoform X1 [Nicotiana tabacum]XP_018627387.1 sister chromatid cohesion 1 protein 4 isoform X2 [Nicotiana tomentosiformis]
MFYSQFILAKKGPLGTIWIAAHLERKLRKNQVADTDIGVSVDSILFPEVPIALRLSSHLLLGVVRIYSRKVGYLFDDCSEALLKVKQAFRSTAVDLPPEESKAPYHSITLPETFELDDFELPDNDTFQGNYVDHHVSSREQITLQDNMEGVVYSTSKFGLDERFGDGDTSGLDLDEELFMDKVAAAGDPSVSADPLASVEPMTPLKQEEHHEEMAANSESMVDGVDGDADFMDHAPCTPGLAEEPNLSNIQETSACEDHLGLEDRHLTEYAVKGNSENLSCENNVNNGSELLENQALTDGSNADNVLFMAPEENGYHLGNTCDKQLAPDGQMPPSEVAIDPVTSSDPPVASGPSSAAVHQANSKSSARECADEIIAASDCQTNERNTQCMLSGMDKVDVSTPGGFHDDAPLPNGISTTKVGHDVSALSSIGQPVPEDISPSNQRSPEAVSNNVAIPGNLDAGESQDITCLETPKTVDCLEQSVFAEDAIGAQVHVLSRCNAAQLDASMSRSEHVINHEPLSTFSGFHPPETSKEEESHVSAGDLEQISKENPVQEPVSCEDILKESNKSTNQADTVVLEDRLVEIMSGSAASALPPPEKILSMPGGLVDLPRSIFSEATPDYLAGIDEAYASGKFISGRKRSYTESTLTEQSLNSVESSRMVRSKMTAGFIPDDDDLLSSILAGRRSSALKLKPTPPPSEKTSSKRPRSAARMSASKRRNVLMDDIMVLHGDMIRQQLIHAGDIRRIRKKAPCTHAEIAAIKKQLLEDEIFKEAVLTDMSVELASLHKQKFDLSTVKVSSSDVSCSHTGMAVDPQLTAVYAENSISNLKEQHQQVTAEYAENPISNLEQQHQQITAEYAENPISNLDEQRAMVFNEPHVERDSGIEGSNEWYVARDDSILGAVEATVPTENKEVDEHGRHLNSDASQLRLDTITDAAVPNDFNLEPSDNAAEVGPQGTCLSGFQAAEATNIASAAEELFSCHNNGGLGGDGDVIAGLPLDDSFNESGKEDAFILAEVSCGPPNHTLAAQVDKALENLNDENLVDGSEWPENNCFTSEAGTGTENMIGNAVLLDAAQDSATAKDATNVENIVAENDNQSFADNVIGTDQPNRDIVYEEMDYMLDHSIGAGQYPCKEEDFSYNTVAADFSDANRGDLNDLDYSAAGDDTGFLNFDDDDEEAEAVDDYVPDADVTRITENSGWSSRTRAVSKYLQTLFIKESERGRKSLSMDSLLVGKTRKEASRMFFEALVLKTRDYVHVEQVIPFDDVTIKPRMQLMKSDF